MSLSGKKQAIVFGVEAEYGTDPAAYDTIGMLQGEPAFNIDNQYVNVFAGGRINSRAILAGPRIVGGRFDYFVQDGAFIVASIGTFDTTSPVTNTDNYIHYGTSEDSTSTEGTPVEYEAESYTMKFGLTGQTKNITITGCKTNTLTLNVDLDQPLRAGVEFYGKTPEIDTDVQTVTEIDYGPYMYHDRGTVEIMGATPTVDMQSLSCSITNDLKREHGCLPAANERDIVALHQGNRDISGTVVLNYDADTELTQLLADERADISFLVDNELTATGATYRGIMIDIKEAGLAGLGDRTYPVDGDTIRETFNFTARKIDCKYYDATSSDPFS